MLKNFSRLKIIFVIFVLVLVDQILKNAALAFLVMPQQINDFLSLEIYKNYGVAFGLPVPANIFYAILIIFLVLVFFGWKNNFFGDWREADKRKICAIVLISAGALGNIIDRMRAGYIIDYINIAGMLVFNLADIFITIGVIVLLEKFLPDTGKGKIKKNIYILLFMVLGAIISFLIHAVIEVWYINLLIQNFSKYSFGFSWPQWYIIHSIGTLIIFAGGLLFGYLQGKHWWRVIYEK